MAITQTNENVQLTFEQLQQLDVVQKKLANLQNEIGIAKNNLTAIRLECETITKERLYQEELLAGLNDTIASVQERKSVVLADLDYSISTLDETTKKIAEQSVKNSITVADLNTRKIALEEQEAAFHKKVEDFNLKHSELLKDQQAITAAKVAFQKATETVVWSN